MSTAPKPGRTFATQESWSMFLSQGCAKKKLAVRSEGHMHICVFMVHAFAYVCGSILGCQDQWNVTSRERTATARAQAPSSALGAVQQTLSRVSRLESLTPRPSAEHDHCSFRDLCINRISTQDKTHANKPRNEHTNADSKAHTKAHTSTDQLTYAYICRRRTKRTKNACAACRLSTLTAR